MALTTIKTGGLADNSVTDAKVADAITVTGAQTGITQVGTLTSFRSTGIDDNADATAITIDSSERVGIGITSSITDPLHVKTTAVETRISLESSTGKWAIGAEDGDKFGILNYGTSTPFIIDSSGRIGIGAVSPTTKLQIKADSAEEDVILLEDNSGTDIGAIRIHGGAFMMKGKSSTAPIQLQTHDGNEDIEVDPDGFIKFETAGSERMRIDSAGTIFQGTTSPTLHSSVRGIIFENGSLINDITRGANKSITLAQNVAIDSGNTWAYLATDEASAYQQYAGNHYFYTCASGSAGADATLSSKLTILNAGNVGIGTTTPSSKLHLSGVDGGAQGITWQSGTSGTNYRTFTTSTFSSAAEGNYLSFNIASGQTTQTSNVLYLRGDGRVGIGCNPGTLFHVSGTGADVISRVECLHSVSSAMIDIVSYAGRDSILRFKEGSTVKARIINDASTDSLVITDGSDAAVLYIEGNQVGIGTVPNKPLDIDADIAGYTLDILNADGGGAEGIRVNFSGYAPNNTSKDFISLQDSGGSKGRWYSNGDIYTTSGTDIQSLSDERLKENIANYTDGLEVINSLQPRTYTWKDGFGDGKNGTRYGFIAQEIKASSKVTDNMNLHSSVPVREDDGDKYDELIDDGTIFGTQLSAKEAILISAIKELSAKVEALENA